MCREKQSCFLVFANVINIGARKMWYFVSFSMATTCIQPVKMSYILNLSLDYTRKPGKPPLYIPTFFYISVTFAFNLETVFYIDLFGIWEHNSRHTIFTSKSNYIKRSLLFLSNHHLDSSDVYDKIRSFRFRFMYITIKHKYAKTNAQTFVLFVAKYQIAILRSWLLEMYSGTICSSFLTRLITSATP